MYRLFYTLSLFLLLQGCESSIEDVHKFVTSIKNEQGMTIKPLPKQLPYIHFEYGAAHTKSPFDITSIEVRSNPVSNLKNCLQPNTERRKSLLENSALDNLRMKGTVVGNKEFWALIQTNEGLIYKVKKDDYIGLFNGRITEVNDQKIIVIEMVADGSGCWVKRKNSLLLEVDI